MRFLAGVAGGADSLIIDMFKKIARKNNTFSATTPEARAAARLEAFTAARRFEVSLPACQPASLPACALTRATYSLVIVCIAGMPTKT